MARLLRIHVIEGSHHGTSRGNGGETLSRRDDDRRALLGLVSGMPDRFGAEVHAVVWMENHDLLLLRRGRTDASETLRWPQSRYSVWFKGAHGRRGQVFQGRVNLETAVGQSVGRVPSRGDGDAACPVRRVRGPGPQPRRAHHDLTRRVSPWVPVHEPIRPDEKGVSSFWHPL